MKRFLILGLVPWLALMGAPAQEPEKPKEPRAPTAATPAERYRDVLKAYQKAQQDFMTAYRAARTEAEQRKVVETSQPDQEKFAGQMLQIATDAPRDPVAVEALIWVALNSYGPRADTALKRLMEDHVQDPSIASLCPRMVYNDSAGSEQFLRAVMAKNPGREARGQACLALGQRLKMQSERADLSKAEGKALSKEAESLLERVTKEFADVKIYSTTLGDTARNELNELRNLGIGKVAPEIQGEDIDGKALKLTDFRGKVVVLDFWGDW
jgi:hypothetical protein